MLIGLIIALIVGGLIVGALGRLLHPGPDPIGIVATIAIGIVANLIVGLLLHAVLGAILSFVVAVIVAALIVALISRRRGGATPGRHRRYL